MTIKKYLKPKKELKWIHYQVDADLYDKANRIRKNLSIGWIELLEALLRRLIDEDDIGNNVKK